MDLHHVTAQVLELTNKLSGGRETPGLEALCLAAVKEYAARLKPGVTVADCAPALISACACVTLSGLAAREGGAAGGDVNSFRIGEVSLSSGRTGATGGTARRAETLRTEAERLMAPYVSAKGFAFFSIRNSECGMRN